MIYLLDTNICIHLFKGDQKLADKVNSVGLHNCYLSEITVVELLFGVENSSLSRRHENLSNVNWLRRAFSDRTLLIGTCFYEYARQKTILKRMGRPVSDFDLLIGATAIAHGLTLVTRNTRDFSNLQGIVLENWIDTP
ncbi:type II toxin-antitoxin system VapC family toxin [Arsenicibacter rosenii]|uniref:Ribonuclease VapC n=1 Tax=Arsenicibacter rosenii TaxID=1750698 RepID=A0A1S2VIQ8_9BACT|nr:type II toxin-antitoxin system VapC family toxin [Arsenicibacter rosenii]OIN58593.1 VapC toxin family PIN domain ribonuclease [Arsenicibacter rosenii]